MNEATAPLPALCPLNALPGITARFIGRMPGVDVVLERQEAMARLAPYHQEILRKEGLGTTPFVTAEQVHGNEIAFLTETPSATELPVNRVDGLATMQRGITLGIYVADCAPVWIVAKNGSAGALLHSGKKGTELGITTQGIALLCEQADLKPDELLVAIGPCIRPPCYEVDFAAMIREQARESGVTEIHDDRICTACHPTLYYSYRRERGLTGRMLATLTLGSL
jgi:polyphenol oxidase